LGLVGNSLSFLVFSRKAFAKQSIGVYCRAVSFWNLFLLLQFDIDIANLSSNQYFHNQIRILCKFNVYFNTGLSPISVWVLLAFSVDKMINVLNTNSLGFIKKLNFQLAVIFGCAFGNALIYVCVPILLELKETSAGNVTTTLCVATNMPYYNLMGAIRLVEANVIPFFLMMVTTVVTLRCLVKSRKNLEKIANRDDKKRRQKDAKFALNSVILNISTIILQVPLVFVYIVPISDLATFQIVNAVCFFLFTVNYSNSFFIFILSNSIFRKEFLRMICLGKKNKISPGSTTGSTINNKKSVV
jgi:hypothetical protein